MLLLKSKGKNILISEIVRDILKQNSGGNPTHTAYSNGIVIATNQLKKYHILDNVDLVQVINISSHNA